MLTNPLFWVLVVSCVCLVSLLVVLLVFLSLRRSRVPQGPDEVLQRLAAQQQAIDGLQNLILTQGRDSRQEMEQGLSRSQQAMTASLKGITDTIERRLEAVEGKTAALTEQVQAKLDNIRTDNAQRLEQMRQTVDERLQATLEQRLGESFKLVSDQLEMVHKSVGEMQGLAAGVGDLKRVLTNIKTRGTWGEVQVGMILQEVLTPDQYETNVATKAGSTDRVEFAVKLPGRDAGDPASHPVYLPVDAKFPKEDYERLLDAQERADAPAVDVAVEAIRRRILSEGKDISSKYLDVPRTTDFAVMFLPTEGLYAEVLRINGLADALQRDYRVVVSGPSTFAAMLNSLQMGFRTLAIERRSSEVWKVLGAVKTEFGRFGDVLEKTHTKLTQAASSIENATVRSRQIERKLRSVESLPVEDAQQLLVDVSE